jgi:hypothetical protein
MMKALNIPTILATTFFAMLLWLSVSLSDQYQVQVNVPLRVDHVPEGKAIAAPLPRAVRLTFNDYGWRLAKMLWGKRVEWTIDLLQLSPRRQVLTLRDVAEQLGAELGMAPMAINPESIYIALDQEAAKRIAVVPDVVVSFREGYGQVSPVVVMPESVTVVGAARVVRSLTAWRTQRRVFEQLRDPINTVVALADTSVPLRFDPPSVRLFLDVQQLAEKTFDDLPVEPIAVPPNREVLLNPQRLSVVIRGGIEQLGRLVPADVRVAVDYRLMVADTTGLIEPIVTLPPGVRLLKKTPERLQFVLRKKNVTQPS